MSSTTIRHSGVHENTQAAAHLATGHSPQVTDYWASASQYPPGSGPGEPYYEPAHLRHKPGDDWKIGGRPHDPDDPDDPDPYGTPGWYQDRRTGRHRRGEAPDPLPETGPEAAEGFSRLREDAYIAFLRDSEELHLAHYETAEANRALIRLRWFLRVLLAVLYWRVLPFPERPAPRSSTRPAPRRIEGRAEPKSASRDAYRPKRAAGKPAERTGRRPGARPGDRASSRDGRRPDPGRRPAPGPAARTAERRRPGSASAAGTGAGGVGSAPQAFFAAVRAARGQARMTGMADMASAVGGEAR